MIIWPKILALDSTRGFIRDIKVWQREPRGSWKVQAGLTSFDQLGRCVTSTPGRMNIWQGEFPSLNTAEDGYIKTAPVDAFGPQNDAGAEDLARGSPIGCR